MTLPTLYIPHGGGPCFFMDWTAGPSDTWNAMGAWLRDLPALLPASAKALLVVSAHWEEPVATVGSGEAPGLIYDYYGFPPHTYELQWPAPGDPALAERVLTLLSRNGIDARADASRGFDHGVFIPLKVSFPDAVIPTVQLSLRRDLDAAEHLAIGRALAPLRDQGVLLLGSGMSYHNMQGFRRESSRAPSIAFDDWLAETVAAPEPQRETRLLGWEEAPNARDCHPREEHLLPLLVCAGAARGDAGMRIYRDEVMGVAVSAHRFG